jgi:RNA polymerase sigma-70 factor (ECF subfamily)
MRAGLAGNAGAYRQALSMLAPRLRSAARAGLARCGRGPDAAEDIVQETLLAIHLKRGTWDPSQPVMPWARAIARYKTIDFLRRKGERVHDDIDDVAEVLAAPETDSSAEAQTARAMMVRLPARDRDIVESMAVEGASARETGARLGMSEGAVRVALHRALKSLAVLCRSGA